MGLLAELVVRTYYESQDKRPYVISEEIGGMARAAEGRSEGSG
jgi:hypothetical protein